MGAYFSSKSIKQIYVVFCAAFLTICLLGTHWVGLAHGISHGHSQNQSVEIKQVTQVGKSIGHSSDVCHLFDALSLAGFIPNSLSRDHANLATSLATLVADALAASKLELASYQSRAPPAFIL